MTHKCINCNSIKVTRDGDTFTCAQCKYTWDVAHEQANAAYLAAQGRKPAVSVFDPVEANDLDAALGLVPDADAGSGKLYEVPGGVADEDAALTDEEDEVRVLREPHPLTGEEADVAERVLGSKTVAEIEAIAAEAGVDLADARLKADKIQALIESGRVYLTDDGETVIVVDDEETDENDEE